MQQLARSPSQQSPCQIPYGLVSLWDMFNFGVASYVYLLRTLEIVERGVRKPPLLSGADLAVAESSAAWTKTAQSVQRAIAETKKLVAPLESHVLAAQFNILEITVEKGGDYSREDVANQIAGIVNTITAELSKHFFYHYPLDKGRMLDRAEKDWGAVIAAFPDATEDILAAIDCYALGHNHASIYHSMMVLERGLPALAKKLKVKIKKDRASWGPIIAEIRDEIDRRQKALAITPKGQPPPSPRAARAARSLLQPCQEAAMQFGYFTDVWRNHVMHGRAKYDENDAKKALDHVRAFMETITIKLKLKGA